MIGTEERYLNIVGRFKRVCIRFRRHYIVRIIDGKRMYDGRCDCPNKPLKSQLARLRRSLHQGHIAGCSIYTRIKGVSSECGLRCGFDKAQRELEQLTENTRNKSTIRP